MAVVETKSRFAKNVKRSLLDLLTLCTTAIFLYQRLMEGNIGIKDVAIIAMIGLAYGSLKWALRIRDKYIKLEKSFGATLLPTSKVQLPNVTLKGVDAARIDNIDSKFDPLRFDPIVVWRMPGVNEYVVIDGVCRYEVAQKRRMQNVPAKIVPCRDDGERYFLAAMFNNWDLNFPGVEAFSRFVATLKDEYDWPLRKIARRLRVEEKEILKMYGLYVLGHH